MQKSKRALFAAGLFSLFSFSGLAVEKVIPLPEPNLDGGKNFRRILKDRRTERVYAERPINQKILSQLLWAAQGISDKKRNRRTVPSAGALYPLEIYFSLQNRGCEGLENGLYQYLPNGHRIKMLKPGNFSSSVARAGYSQDFFSRSPLCLFITAVPQRTTKKYGRRGYRYIYMEVGHAGQNIQLQGAALDLSVGIVGAFKDEVLADFLNLGRDEIPLYILPVGYPR